jgi:serine/threonine protein kinase
MPADNVMLRAESQRLVLIDFGLSTSAQFIRCGIDPVGSQTHWSPEKAASSGYDYSADLWAAICIFVHILSGTEPWVTRFPDHGFLHFIVRLHLVFALLNLCY